MRHQTTVGPWGILSLLSLAFVLNYIDRQVVFTIFPLLRGQLGFSDVDLGLAGSLFTWSYSLCMPVAGRLADLWPRHRLVVASIALWSVATLGTALAVSPAYFLFWRVAMGLAESLYVPAAIGMIATAHPDATRSRALSIHGFAQFTGITLGGWYGGWAADHIGWRYGFGSLAATGVLYAGFLGIWLRGFQSKPVPRVSRAGEFVDLFRSRLYVALCFSFLAFCSMLWMLYAWLPNHIFETFHLSLAQSGLTATLYLQASSAVGVLAGGALGDKTSQRSGRGRFYVVSLGLFLCAPFATAVYGATSLRALEAFACGFGIFAGWVASNVFATLADVVAPEHFGVATGLLNLAGGLGAGAAILVTGLLRDTFSSWGLMTIASITAMLAATSLFFSLRRYLPAAKTGKIL